MNEIQRRLVNIDRELSRCPSYYLNRAISTAPLVFCALGLIAGIVIRDNLYVPVWFCLSLLSVSIVVTLIFLKSRVELLSITVTICFTCLGMVRLAVFNEPAANDIRNCVGDEPIMATIRGVIITQPYIDSSNWAFSKFAHTDRSSSFYLKVTGADTIDGWKKAAGVVRVRVQEPVFDLKGGDYTQIYCTLDRFRDASNPGEFDAASYLARKGVYAAASVKSRDAIELQESPVSGLFTKIRAMLQRFSMQTLLASPVPVNEQDSLLLALVLGRRTNLSQDTIEAFRKTGLLHFICLSGMNFAMVIWFIWWVCKTAGLMKPARALVCMLSAVLFLLIVPENAPAFRAAVMSFSFCSAFIFRRTSNSYNSLSLAAIVLLLLRPTGIFEADWQLTFISVLGILLLSPPIKSLLNGKLPGWLSAPFSVSLAAWSASAGVLLYHFHSIQPITSFWTVLVSPLIGLVSTLGYLKLAIGLFLPSISALMGILTGFLAGLLISLVKILAAVDITEILVGKTVLFSILLYYALLIYAFFFGFKFPLVKRTVIAAGAATLAVILLLPAWQNAHRDTLTITTLDAGHGQAIVAQMPDGKNILFDAGSLSRDNIGERVVLPFLKYSRLKNIDAIILSHGDIDHINGIPEIIQNSDVRDIFASEVFLSDNRPAVKFLQGEITQKIGNISNLPGDFGSAGIKILWPNPDIIKNNQVSDNDKSIVALIEYAGRRILISSDAEKFAQAEILRLYPDLSIDVLIAPHHGSKKTMEREFLEALQPKVVICSNTNAAFNKGQVIKQQTGFSTYYTGKDGAITVRINKTGLIETTEFRKDMNPLVR